MFLQGDRAGGGELAELRSYLIARCLWDPYDDWRQHMTEFLEAYYGAAAGPIARYIDALNNPMITHRPDSDLPLGYYLHTFDSPTAWGAAKILNRRFVESADALFDQAEAAVADDPERLWRVRKERLPLLYLKISRHGDTFETTADMQAAVDEFAAVAERYHIAKISEGGALGPILEQWKEQVKNRARPGQ